LKNANHANHSVDKSSFGVMTNINNQYA